MTFNKGETVFNKFTGEMGTILGGPYPGYYYSVRTIDYERDYRGQAMVGPWLAENIELFEGHYDE